MSSKPLVSFGVLTDVQYADRDDCPSWYSADKVRYYRNSLNHIRKAFETWEREKHSIHFAVQLGDLFDCCNRSMDLDPDAAARKTLSIFNEFHHIPTHHVLGNHELDNFNRNQLAQYFDMLKNKNDTNSLPGDMQRDVELLQLAYYKFSPVADLVVIVLDCFEICLPNYDRENPTYLKVKNFLSKFHTTEDMMKWDYDDHLEGIDKRYVAYNGAIGKEQLEWLNNQLQTAEQNGQKVIICGHIPVCPESSSPTCIVWNYSDVLKVLHQHNCVIAYLAGHLHDTGYAMDNHGIHHVTFAGIIEASPDQASFSTVHMLSDRLEIIGHGLEKSYTLNYASKKPLSVENAMDNTSSLEVQVQA